MVFKMEAALLQQPQWNMNAMMADNEEVDSDEAVSDDEGIEGFNVSPLSFFFFIFSSTIVNIPRGIIILGFAAIVLELFVSIMNIFFCVIVGNYQLMVPPALHYQSLFFDGWAFYYSAGCLLRQRPVHSFRPNCNVGRVYS
jgi:hypothetical protein